MTVRVRVAATGVALGALAFGAFTAPVATAAPALPSAPTQTAAAESTQEWSPADSAAIHPGVVTESAGGGACTSNFIFTSGDRTFIGQAAHCAGTGEATETNGCDSASGPLGTEVLIKADDGTDRPGTLAYSSWLTMQEIGETDTNTCQYNDFALVEISPDDVADINPSIPFFGGPTGIDADGVPAGEQVFSYGNSPLRQGIMELSPKTGVSAGDTGEGWSHDVFTVTPGVPGDSGSAFLNAEGNAFGLLSTLNLAPLPVSNGVSDIAKALDYANANGGLGELVLELGTEPFNPTPLGIAPAAVAPPAGPPAAG